MTDGHQSVLTRREQQVMEVVCRKKEVTARRMRPVQQRLQVQDILPAVMRYCGYTSFHKLSIDQSLINNIYLAIYYIQLRGLRLGTEYTQP